MHDPMSVAFEIKYPWVAHRTTMKDGTVHNYREPFVTVWHVDPETDGTDDSCSVRERLTKAQRSMLKWHGELEGDRPWFRRERAKEPSSPADAECLLRGALWDVARALRLDRRSWRHRRMTFARCAELASELLHNPVDNVRGSMCLLPGWHTNDPMVNPHPLKERHEELDVNSPEWEQYMDEVRAQPLSDYPEEASEWARKEEGKSLMFMCASILSRETARWWQHPKWHVHHWKVQIRPLQKLRRWLFERCEECGERFGWNEAPVSYSWSGNGPCFHSGCTRAHETRSAVENVIRQSQVTP